MQDINEFLAKLPRAEQDAIKRRFDELSRRNHITDSFIRTCASIQEWHEQLMATAHCALDDEVINDEDLKDLFEDEFTNIPDDINILWNENALSTGADADVHNLCVSLIQSAIQDIDWLEVANHYINKVKEQRNL